MTGLEESAPEVAPDYQGVGRRRTTVDTGASMKVTPPTSETICSFIIDISQRLSVERRTMETHTSEYLQAYSEYAKVLRTWFVAYGIGGPVLLFTNDALSRALKSSGKAKIVAVFFLAGVVLQVVLAAVNKVAMWALYYGEIQRTFKSRRRYKIGFWFSEAFWIHLSIDLVTMFLFALATWRVFDVLVI
jgi:hypothetical protein